MSFNTTISGGSSCLACFYSFPSSSATVQCSAVQSSPIPTGYQRLFHSAVYAVACVWCMCVVCVCCVMRVKARPCSEESWQSRYNYRLCRDRCTGSWGYHLRDDILQNAHLSKNKEGQKSCCELPRPNQPQRAN